MPAFSRLFSAASRLLRGGRRAPQYDNPFSAPRADRGEIESVLYANNDVIDPESYHAYHLRHPNAEPEAGIKRLSTNFQTLRDSGVDEEDTIRRTVSFLQRDQNVGIDEVLVQSPDYVRFRGNRVSDDGRGATYTPVQYGLNPVNKELTEYEMMAQFNFDGR